MNGMNDQGTERPTTAVSRRRFLQGTAALTMTGGLLTDLLKTAHALEPAEVAGSDPDLHFLRRISFAPTPQELQKVRDMGRDAYLQEQLTLQDSATELDVTLRYPLVAGNALTTFVGSAAGIVRTVATGQLQAAMIYRAVHSQAQLFEVMVDFWNDHFNTYIDKNPVPLKLTFDREAIRPNALGNFKTLLRATVFHAEMLHYLDNWLNSAESINENYARELLELHTLGRDGGYTDADLKALARILSGWTYTEGVQGDPLNGQFYADVVFKPELHDTSAKRFLGHDFAAGGGAEELDRALELLVDHPSTAQYIAQKLCAKFVADKPPASLVAAVTNTFTTTDGDIPSMLRVIFQSAEFANSAGQKFKRPINAMAGAVRAIGMGTTEYTVNIGLFGTVNGAGALVEHLTAGGQAPFGWVPPNGYPDERRYWSNTNSLLQQQKFLVQLAESLSYGRLLDDPLGFLLQGTSIASAVTQASTPREAVDNALRNLLLEAIPASGRSAILDFMAQGGDPDTEVDKDELENRVKGLVFVLLSSPWFLVR